MRKTVGIKWGGLKVGIVLMFSIAAMLWASLGGGGTSIFSPKNEFICYFTNVNGLVAGSPVWMAGVEVGNVRGVDFVNLSEDRVVKVSCRIKESVWPMMTRDAQVQLGTIGFLGDKYVEIIPGTPGMPTIPDGSVVPTRDAGSAEAVFKAGEEAIGEARSLTANLDTVLIRMNQGQGTLGRLATDDALYVELTTLSSQMASLIKDLQSNQERIVGSIERTANSVGMLSDKVDSNTGTLGRLMNDPDLYDNLAATSAKLDTMLYKINSAEGSLGMLVSDTALYVEVVDLLARTNTLVKDIQENPRKYFKFSVF